jgi:hypothetical protein
MKMMSKHNKTRASLKRIVFKGDRSISNKTVFFFETFHFLHDLVKVFFRALGLPELYTAVCNYD